MNYSDKDIDNLNKIIDALANNSIGLVPDILYGYQNIPASNSPEDLDARAYEDILIDNGICAFDKSLRPNDTPGGYKVIYLDRGGREILRSKVSIRDFLEQKRQDSKPPLPTIHVGGNAIIGSNNSGNNQDNIFGKLLQGEND